MAEPRILQRIDEVDMARARQSHGRSAVVSLSRGALFGKVRVQARERCSVRDGHKMRQDAGLEHPGALRRPRLFENSET